MRDERNTKPERTETMNSRYEVRLNGVTVARFTMLEKYEAYMFLARVCVPGVEMVDMLTGYRVQKNGGLAVRLPPAA